MANGSSVADDKIDLTRSVPFSGDLIQEQMRSENWEKIKSAFNDAVDLDPAGSEGFLDLLGKSEPEIAGEVRKLLAAESKNKFASPVADIAGLWKDDMIADLTGTVVGIYRIVRQIGHGGMGVVYEARRDTDDFSQTVALKLLKRGMDSDAMLRRFRQERQILASLEHPNIARLLDGGLGPEGTPFFAMEYVSGRPLDEYCREERLSINERLQLFLQVCSAVSFAHSRLVIHRDLKPNNILVTADGTVKLLDFGIAKLVSPESDGPNETATGLTMMTPAYASPEQIRGDIVSTASDIYSLGLILFETLTGSAAYILPSNRPDEIARVICDVDPPRPSSVVSVEWMAVSACSTQQAKDPSTLQPRRNDLRQLKGDLDTIILKALRKEPDRRYASVEQFAGDIKRHLEGLTVLARPDTLSYRVEKFIARNRIAVGAATLVVLALVGGIATTTWQAVRAENQRRISEQRFTQVRELANNIVFKYYDEAEKLPNSTKLREMLVTDSLNYFDSLAMDANADDALKSELALAYIRIGKVMGRAYFANLGDVSGAITNYQKGISLLEPISEKSGDIKLKVDLINAESELATALRRQGSVAESDAMLKKAIEQNETLVTSNPGDTKLELRLVTLYLFLGDSLPVGTGAGENIAAFQRSIDVCESILKREPDNVRTNNILAAAADRIATNLTILARDAADDGNADLAHRLHQQALELGARNIQICQRILDLQPDEVLNSALLNATNFNYGTYQFESGDYVPALQNQLASERGFRKEFENDKSNLENKLLLSSVLSALSTTQMRLAKAADSQRSYEEAVKILNELIAVDAENFDYKQKRWEAKFALADELARAGAIEKARALYLDASTEIDKAAREKDSAYGESLRGFYLSRIGDLDAVVAKLIPVASPKHTSLIQSAKQSYTQALDIWIRNGAQSVLGIHQPNKIEVLKRKLERIADVNR